MSLWHSFKLLQNHQTPVHLAAHLGHVEVLRVLIKGYHADKMVKAMVNVCHTVLLYTETLCNCVPLITCFHLLLCVC